MGFAFATGWVGAFFEVLLALGMLIMGREYGME
jgi:hypothetical protein